MRPRRLEDQHLLVVLQHPDRLGRLERLGRPVARYRLDFPANLDHLESPDRLGFLENLGRLGNLAYLGRLESPAFHFHR